MPKWFERGITRSASANPTARARGSGAPMGELVEGKGCAAQQDLPGSTDGRLTRSGLTVQSSTVVYDVVTAKA
jgi:hypothetical protein